MKFDCGEDPKMCDDVCVYRDHSKRWHVELREGHLIASQHVMMSDRQIDGGVWKWRDYWGNDRITRYDLPPEKELIDAAIEICKQKILRAKHERMY